MKVFLVCLVFSGFFSSGIDFGGVDREGYSRGYFSKIEHPFWNVAKISGVNSHDANLNFRLTVPVILHVLGIRTPLALPFLTIVAISLILVISCMIAHQLTRDRVCACLIALNVSATYVGSYAFICYYDAIAICQVALAALPSVPCWLRGLLVFTASFTDERAFVVSSLFLVACFFQPALGFGIVKRLRQPDFLCISAAMVAYWAGRLSLMKFAGLASPTGGVGISYLLYNMTNFLHPAVWYAFEGGWLLYGLALIVLLANKEYNFGLWLIITTLGLLTLYLMIGDVLRSTIYIFPLLFISLAIVSRNEALPQLRHYCLLAFLISALGGNYNVFLSKITWFQPLAVHELHRLGEAVYQSIYDYLPHSLPRR